jgi:hypothetical protein
MYNDINQHEMKLLIRRDKIRNNADQRRNEKIDKEKLRTDEIRNDNEIRNERKLKSR